MTDGVGAPTPTTRKNAIPTNMILYKNRRMPARIDPEARVAYIVEVMAASFATKEHHITLCLRDEGDALVTQGNLASRVKEHANLRLVPSSTTEALNVVTSLRAYSARPSMDSSSQLPDQPTVIPLKLALFNLQKYIKEEDFAVEFMLKGGMRVLLRLLERPQGGLSGNSLAYALQGIRGILEFEAGWSDLSDTFIDRVLALLVSSSAPNVLRPATAIIRKLIIAGDSNRNRSLGKKAAREKGKSRAMEAEAGDDVTQYGFDRVWSRIAVAGRGVEDDTAMPVEGRVLKVVVRRLEGTGDLELVAQSLGLINAALRSAHQATSPHFPALVSILEHLSIRRYVSRLMPTSSDNIVSTQILNFQARYVTMLQFRRLAPVRPAQNAEQDRMMGDIWEAGRLGRRHSLRGAASSEGAERERSWVGWRKVGFGMEEGEVLEGAVSEGDMFRDVGELGLECLHYFAMHEENFANIIMEQQARPPERRCPIGPASAECVKALCEHYKVSQAGHHTPTSFQQFLLNFPKLHHLVLRFFMRMWQESESRLDDFARVALLLRTQIRLSLADEAAKSWLHIEKDLLEANYREIRDRQLELLEREDGMLTRASIIELRERLGKEAYEVLAEQRVGCMLQGNWFNSGIIVVQGLTSAVKANPAKPLRFLRLSPNRRTIAWDEFATRTATPPPFETLRERIDIANITSLMPATACAVNSRSTTQPSKLSFSLMADEGMSLLDLDAVHAAQLAEWTDGIRVLSGGPMGSQDSGNFVHILAELALKVRLLDITGDGVELPDKVPIGIAPRSADFWFAK